MGPKCRLADRNELKLRFIAGIKVNKPENNKVVNTKLVVEHTADRGRCRHKYTQGKTREQTTEGNTGRGKQN